MKNFWLLTSTLFFGVFVLFFIGNCYGNKEEKLKEVKEQYEFTQQQILHDDVNEDMNNLRNELEQLNKYNSKLSDDVETLMLLISDLHMKQEKEINDLRKNLLAIHECAQLTFFIEKIRNLCTDPKEHYCRVVENFMKHCHTVNDKNIWHLPTNPKIMKYISWSIKQNNNIDYN